MTITPFPSRNADAAADHVFAAHDRCSRSPVIQTVTLSLYRFDTRGARAWAFAMMGAARPALARVPDLTFWKLCGAGSGEGFTPRLDMRVCAILCAWKNADAAAAGLRAEVFSRYARQAVETWTVHLSPLAARGAWSGGAPFVAANDAGGDGPLAVLTRATLRARALPFFWRRVPDVSAAIGQDPNVAFKIGLGEVPFLHQITFSIWPDAATMAAFARRHGPHARAVAAVRAGDWFAEELYARFRVTGATGTWDGGDPIARAALDKAA